MQIPPCLSRLRVYSTHQDRSLRTLHIPCPSFGKRSFNSRWYVNRVCRECFTQRKLAHSRQAKSNPKWSPIHIVATLDRVTHHDSLSKTILQGTLEGGRRRGQQRKFWMDNNKEWTSLLMPELLTKASCRKGLLQKRLEEKRLNRPSCPHDDPIDQGTELN